MSTMNESFLTYDSNIHTSSSDKTTPQDDDVDRSITREEDNTPPFQFKKDTRRKLRSPSKRKENRKFAPFTPKQKPRPTPTNKPLDDNTTTNNENEGSLEELATLISELERRKSPLRPSINGGRIPYNIMNSMNVTLPFRTPKIINSPSTPSSTYTSKSLSSKRKYDKINHLCPPEISIYRSKPMNTSNLSGDNIFNIHTTSNDIIDSITSSNNIIDSITSSNQNNNQNNNQNKMMKQSVIHNNPHHVVSPPTLTRPLTAPRRPGDDLSWMESGIQTASLYTERGLYMMPLPLVRESNKYKLVPLSIAMLIDKVRESLLQHYNKSNSNHNNDNINNDNNNMSSETIENNNNNNNSDHFEKPKQEIQRVLSSYIMDKKKKNSANMTMNPSPLGLSFHFENVPKQQQQHTS